MKHLKILFSLFILFIGLFALSGTPVHADPVIDTTRGGQVTVEYLSDGEPISTEFHLYKLADVDAYGNYTYTYEFVRYELNLNITTTEGWDQLAETLAGYVARDGILSIVDGVTDNEGLLTFPYKGQESMMPGLYLIIGDNVTVDDVTYSCKPFITNLPRYNLETGEFDYSVIVSPKYSKITKDHISISVRKVWEDSGFELIRPVSVTVSLYKNGEVYDTVVLNEQNNWRYKWDDLDAECSWTISEAETANYTAAVSADGYDYVITNTYNIPPVSDEIPVSKKILENKPRYNPEFRFTLKADDSSYPMPAGSADGIKTLSIFGEGTAYFGRIDFTSAGTYTYRIYEERTNEANFVYDTEEYILTYYVTSGESGLQSAWTLTLSDGTPVQTILFKNRYRPYLPVTGLDWTPVYILAVSGVLFILLGFILKKGKDK